MRLFAGLGNPGAKYAGQRHNIGFMALDAIAAAHGATPWRSKFRAETAEALIGGQKVLLIKPQTYMNRSGDAVAEAARFFRLPLEAIWVFHDELDLAPGRVRVKQGGGHAGHNGLRSIHGHLGDGYGRVRLGIGHPGHKDRVTPHVLGDFAKAEREGLDDLLRGIADGAPRLAAGDTAGFLNAVALRTAPARPPNAPRGGAENRAPAADRDVAAGVEQRRAPSPLERLKARFR